MYIRMEINGGALNACSQLFLWSCSQSGNTWIQRLKITSGAIGMKRSSASGSKYSHFDWPQNNWLHAFRAPPLMIWQ